MNKKKLTNIEMQQLSSSSKSNETDDSKNKKLRNSLIVKFSKLFCKNNNNDSQTERIIKYTGKNNDCIINPNKKYEKNVINNQKYSLLTFIPKFLYEQFNQFFNLYFLCIALTQVPIKGSVFEELWVGYWWTWIAPLLFVLGIALIRELYDDINRMIRDRRINKKLIKKILLNNSNNSDNKNNLISIKSSDIKIGDILILNENDVVPCDMILLWCSSKKGNTFIRTDQLDGETDWKLRTGISYIQNKYNNYSDITNIIGELKIEAPKQEIYDFVGTFTNENDEIIPLNLENTLWSTCVVASGTCVGITIYTGNETKQMLNNTDAVLKTGKIDIELNYYGKLLFVILMFLSIILTFAQGFNVKFYLFFGRFMLLLSAIIPISLRVHMDLAKIFFSYMISIDNTIKDTIVRSSTIPEELGRIEYIFTDKTGTLTENEMLFKKIVLIPPLSYNIDNIDLIRKQLKKYFEKYCNNDNIQESLTSNSLSIINEINKKLNNISSNEVGIELPNDIEPLLNNSNPNNSHISINVNTNNINNNNSNNTLNNIDISILNNNNTNNKYKVKSSYLQLWDIIEAMALCHNVTPIINADNTNKINYHASSPDEVALVKFTELIGVKLVQRTNNMIKLLININEYEKEYIYDILRVFPFTSESKRMGIILKCNTTNSIIFFVKGAESVMKNIVKQNHWLDEEVENIAREGLRTLVFSKKYLTVSMYTEWKNKYNDASCAMQNRNIQMHNVRTKLENEMELLGITGVEDKLQNNVPQTLEILRNAKIKIWMLTGDKIETAKVIARSSKLVSFGQEIYELSINNKRDALYKLDILGTKQANSAIIIDGKSLNIFLEYYKNEFIDYITDIHIVICCRCSPQQKTEMVNIIQKYTNKICCAIGDGGNDVGMILKAHIGIGIVGKEGQQASLASDFSIVKFENISKLILWHGRLAYKNTAKMAQFVIHRGLIIALMQSLFSVIYYFSAVPIFTGAIAVGYTVFYTSMPVFLLVLDEDVSSNMVLYYPELYHNINKCLSNKTFLQWTMRSVFQSGIIMLLTMIFFENNFHYIVSITFTALILTELFNVCIEIKRWHILMILAEIASIILYITSMFILKTYFDQKFILTFNFWWKSILTASCATLPLGFIKYIHRKANPSMHAKLKGHYKSSLFN